MILSAVAWRCEAIKDCSDTYHDVLLLGLLLHRRTGGTEVQGRRFPLYHGRIRCPCLLFSMTGYNFVCFYEIPKVPNEMNHIYAFCSGACCM